MYECCTSSFLGDEWSSSVCDAQLALDACCKVLTWAGMSFRASKSRSLVISKGKIQSESRFSIGSGDVDSSKVVIPSITELPVKFLGRVIHGSLTDNSPGVLHFLWEKNIIKLILCT